MNKAVKEFKEIYKEEYKVELSDEDTREVGQNLLNFMELLLKIDHRERKSKKT